jgi:mono/diheme cytochrome c family protein
MEEGKPASRKRIETRVVVKQNDRWVGYTYIWNDEQTDATLVEAAGADRTYSIKDRASPGGVRRQVWHFPSRIECMFCHSRAAGFVLGLTTPQMNRDHKYDAAIDNQLRTLSHIGLFKTELPKPATAYRAYPDPFNPAADLSERVKTYLQVNCSMCHVADGGGNSLIDLAYKTPLAKARMLNEPPIHETFGLAKARLIAPGDPRRSVMYYRMSHRGLGQMPPTSTNRIDQAGAGLLREWIKQLQ